MRWLKHVDTEFLMYKIKSENWKFTQVLEKQDLPSTGQIFIRELLRKDPRKTDSRLKTTTANFEGEYYSKSQ